MPKLPKLKGKELIKILSLHGFDLMRIKGSPHILPRDDGWCTVAPVHSGETLGPGLLIQILKDTELDRVDLLVK